MTENNGNVESHKEVVSTEMTVEGKAWVDPEVVSDSEGLSPNDFRQYRKRAQWEAELSLLSNPTTLVPDPDRSLLADMFGGGTVLDDLTKVTIETAYEKLLQETCQNSEAVAVARIAQLKNVAQLSSAYSTVSNAILGIAEVLGITIKEDRYSDRLEKMTYERPVKVGDTVSTTTLRYIAHLILARATASEAQEKGLTSANASLTAELNATKINVREQQETIGQLRNLPRPKPISSLPYVICGLFDKRTEEGTTRVLRYLTDSKSGVVTTSTNLTKAARFSTSIRAYKKLLWLHEHPSEHTVEDPRVLNVMALSVSDVDVPEGFASRLEVYRK